MFELLVLLSQLLDFVATSISQGVSGQTVLSSLQEGLRPFVVDRCRYALSPTDLRYGRLASQTFKNDTDLLICGELTTGDLSDLCDNVISILPLFSTPFRGQGPDYGAKIADFKCFPACRKTLEPLP